MPPLFIFSGQNLSSPQVLIAEAYSSTVFVHRKEESMVQHYNFEIPKGYDQPRIYRTL